MPRRRRSSWIFVVAYFCGLECPSLIHAAEIGGSRQEYLMRAWQVEEGLPHNIVNQVFQDRTGYLWLATSGGLVRFDGMHFREFPLPGSPKEVMGVYGLQEEKDGSLLLVSATDLIFRLKDSIFTLHPASGSGSLRTFALFREPQGAIWLGHHDRITRWDDGKRISFGTEHGIGFWSSFATNKTGEVWIGSRSFLGFYRDGKLLRVEGNFGSELRVASARSGGIWIGSHEQLLKIEEGVTRVLASHPPWAGLAHVQALFEDKEGVLWIGTNTRGLFRFAGGEFDSVATLHKQIMALTQDHEGNLWAATRGGGINLLRKKPFTVFDSNAGLDEDVSTSVCEDKNGVIWFANRGGGLARLKVGRIEVLTQRKDWPRLFVNLVCPDAHGNLWLLADTGLFRVESDPPDTLRRTPAPPLRGVRVLFASANSDVWVGGESGLLGRFRAGQFEIFSRTNGFSGGDVRALAEDAAGHVWIGTTEGTLFEFFEGRFNLFTSEHGLPGKPIRAIHADTAGLLWIGTLGGGLLLRHNGKFHSFATAEGLPTDHIHQLLDDSNDRLWLGSYRGAFHVAKQELIDCARGTADKVNAVHFGKDVGLSGISCLGEDLQPAAWKSRNGHLWLSTRKGVLSINPAMQFTNTNPPPVLLNEVLLDGKPMAFSADIKVPHAVRKLEFRFAALSYAAPENVQVRYRLDGFDSDWVHSGGQRFAVYPKLPPGQYRFQVIACNNSGLWNEQGAALALTVLPAWWHTIIFRASALMCFAALTAGCARYWTHRRFMLRLARLEQQQALERERARIARDLHDDLGASLTQIGLLLEDIRDDDRPAKQMDTHASDLSTRVRTLVRDLDAIVWTVDPKNDSLAGLAAYLSHCFLEFFRNTPIRARLEVSEDLPEHPLSPEARHHLFLIAKGAMSNVLKHSGATDVWLRLGIANGSFQLCLEDNGRGFSPESAARSHRHGLRNLHARVQELGGQLELLSQPRQGATLCVRIPLTATAQPNSK